MPLKIRIKQVAAADFGQPIGYLADIGGFKWQKISLETSLFDDEMMIMVGLTSFEIDQVIKGFHKKRIAGIPLKAVLTDENRKLQVRKLYEIFRRLF